MPEADSIIDLTRQLVRLSSRAGIDPYEPIIALARTWLRAHKVPSTLLRHGKQTVGLVATVTGAAPGPVYMLNATLDTAGFGDESRWTDPPTSGRVRNGWMYGRGTADSKAGAAIFCQYIGRQSYHAFIDYRCWFANSFQVIKQLQIRCCHIL